jgi:hypothetical protein
MTEQIRGTWPRPRDRMTGVVYLLYFLTAILAQLLAGRKLVASGIAMNLIANGFYLALTLLFYYLFKPVSRSISALAALFSFAGCVVASLGLFPLTSLSFSPLLFFAPYCLLIGYLTFRSAFLPRTLGVLMVLAGLGWLTFLLPHLPSPVSIGITVLGIVAEASLMLWLIMKGVDAQQWSEQASAALKRASNAPVVGLGT